MKACAGTFDCLQSCAVQSFIVLEMFDEDSQETTSSLEKQENKGAMFLSMDEYIAEAIAENNEEFEDEETTDEEISELMQDEDIAEEQDAEDDDAIVYYEAMEDYDSGEITEEQDAAEDEFLYEETNAEQATDEEVQEAEDEEEEIAEEATYAEAEEESIQEAQLENVDREVLEAERLEQEGKVIAVAAKADDNDATLASSEHHGDSSHSGKDNDHGTIINKV